MIHVDIDFMLDVNGRVSPVGIIFGDVVANNVVNHRKVFMNRKAAFLLSVFALTPLPAWSAQDTGKIVEIYAHPNGQMAVRFDTGFPNSRAANTCGFTGDPVQQYAGISATDSAVLKSTLLAAKASNSTVRVITIGNCIGEWQKIEAVHVF